MPASTDKKFVAIYDTTLRDGTQRRGLSLSVDDKLKIASLLDEFQVAYIEGGWPGSNPKDQEFFSRARDLNLKHSKLTAFGSTRRAKMRAEDDINLRALIEAETPVVTIGGKTWDLHVKDVLQTTPDENLKMIEESVAFLKAQGREVIYDAEHLFDGFRANRGYALSTLMAAKQGGADVIVLCDTNGGSLPGWVADVVGQLKNELEIELGIHTHNDSELAVANSLAAIESGCRHVQGTINGYGERCGNANLVSIIPNLQLKMGYQCVPAESITGLTRLSRRVSEIVNLNPDDHAAYVGSAAFAHKGGIHVAAVEKNPVSYEHVAPEIIGNKRMFVVSELSGRGNVRLRGMELGLDLEGTEKKILDKIKKLEHEGYKFESAEGTFELLIRREQSTYNPPFSVLDMHVESKLNKKGVHSVSAALKVQVGTDSVESSGAGAGPVNALDEALRSALLPAFPFIDQLRLVDYKVRIINPDKATAATARVLIEAAIEGDRWITVGVSQNLIEASFQALSDSYELFILRNSKAV